MKRSWKRVLKLYRRDHFEVNTYTRVCEFHFASDDIKISLGIGRKTLISGAVPSKNLGKEDAKMVLTPSRKSPRKRICTKNLSDKITLAQREEKEPYCSAVSREEKLELEISDLKNEAFP